MFQNDSYFQPTAANGAGARLDDDDDDLDDPQDDSGDDAAQEPDGPEDAQGAEEDEWR